MSRRKLEEAKRQARRDNDAYVRRAWNENEAGLRADVRRAKEAAGEHLDYSHLTWSSAFLHWRCDYCGEVGVEPSLHQHPEASGRR